MAHRVIAVVFFHALVLTGLPALSQSARVQIVHNSPYAEAAEVDVYLDGVPALDNFAFRTATAYMDIPAGAHTVAVTAWDAPDVANPLFQTSFELNRDTGYIVVAAGDPLGRVGNRPFEFMVFEGSRETSSDPEMIEVFSVEGSPDIPNNNTIARGIGVIIEDSNYGEFNDEQLFMPPGVYDIDTYASDEVLVSVVVDVSEDAGKALFFASTGFTYPTHPEDPPLGLMRVDTDGTVTLMPHNVAKVRFVNAAPSSSVSALDVFLNGLKVVDDLPYATASPIVEIPSGALESTAPVHTVDLMAFDAPGGANPILRMTNRQYLFGSRYLVVGMGDPLEIARDFLVTSTSYSSPQVPAPPGQVSLAFLHAIGDGPDLSLRVEGETGQLLERLAYRAVGGFYQVPRHGSLLVSTVGDEDQIMRLNLDLPAEQVPFGTLILAGLLSDEAPLTAFVVPPEDPSVAVAVPLEHAGPPAGLPARFFLHGNYPNPFNLSTTIRFDLPEPAEVTVVVFDLTGREVRTAASKLLASGTDLSVPIDATGLASGTYVYRIVGRGSRETYSGTGRMVVVR